MPGSADGSPASEATGAIFHHRQFGARLKSSLARQWAGYTSANAASLTSLDALAGNQQLPGSALNDFGAFAAEDGITVPVDLETDGRLQRALVRGVSAGRSGDEGYYRITALTDPDVAADQGGFDNPEREFALRECPRPRRNWRRGRAAAAD